MKRARHFNGKIVIFTKIKYGKHAKNEMIVYNSLYAKISSCLSSFAIVTSFLACATLGKYKGTVASSDIARVAKYYVELKCNQTAITEILPKTTQNIDFEVKNYEEKIGNIISRSEVNLKYKILIEYPEEENLPLDYKLYRVSEGDIEEEVTLNGGESDYIEVGVSTVSHKYRLKLIWQDKKDAILYQNITDNIKIVIKSEQKD